MAILDINIMRLKGIVFFYLKVQSDLNNHLKEILELYQNIFSEIVYLQIILFVLYCKNRVLKFVAGKGYVFLRGKKVKVFSSI